MDATKVQDFTQMNPLVLVSSKSAEDPYKILKSIQKVTKVMGVTLIESVNLIAY